MMSARIRYPFTASQWQELENQALIFKYIISGMPVPPDLLYAVKRSYLVSPLSTKLFPLHSQHVGWNCFQMGLGRKVDPEPGRCRRTDGKKWRCSKEAYPDSKYCERHMHRGKNRSRKPVEIPSSASAEAAAAHANPPRNNTLSLTHSFPSSVSSETHHHLHHPSSYTTTTSSQFIYPHTSSSRPPCMGLSLQGNNTSNFLVDAASCSQPNMDYRSSRHVYGMKEDVGGHAFFSEPSGNVRNLANSSSMHDSWNFMTPLSVSSYSKQKDSISFLHGVGQSYLQLENLESSSPDSKEDTKQDQHLYIMGSDIKCHDMQGEEEPQKRVHRFIDEWPLKSRDSSWLDLDDKSSSASYSTTRLSISTPASSHDFLNFSTRK